MRQRRPCSAKSARTGQPCKHWAIHGGAVCRTHGGAAPQVKRKAAERLADLIDPDRILREAARLACSDVRDLFDDRGNLLPIKQWPDHMAAAVGGVEVIVKNAEAGDGHTDRIHKLKIWDKPKNIELLMRHLGLLNDKLDVTVNVDIVARVAEARRRFLAAGDVIDADPSKP